MAIDVLLAAVARCPTGAAGGPRRRLPSGPAIGSGMPVGPSASGSLRAGLEAVLAKPGEVDHEVDAVDYSLAKIVAPVEHGRQSMDDLGRNVRSATEVAAKRKAPAEPLDQAVFWRHGRFAFIARGV